MAAEPYFVGIARSSTNALDELIRGVKYPNVAKVAKVGATANTTHHGELVGIAGIPTRCKIKIADDASTAGANSVWPRHATTESTNLGSQSGATGTTVILPTGHTAAKGMAIMIIAASRHQMRLVDNVSGDTITVNSAWDAQPQSGDAVRLGIYAIGSHLAYLKSEFSVDQRWIRGLFLWYGMPYDAEGVAAAPVVIPDDMIVEARTTNAIDGVGAAVAASQVATEETSYFHGHTIVRQALGPAMWRFQILVAPSTGTVSLWGDVG